MAGDARAPLLLVHGGAHGAWCWQPLLPHLETRAIAVDLPPKAIRGVTTAVAPPPETMRIGLREFADEVLAAADEAGLGRFVLVGHSMGGLTVAEVARRAPDRVAHLVFVSCMVPPEGLTMIDALPAALREMTRASMERARNGDIALGIGIDDALKRHMFCNDMDEAQTRFVLERCGHECPSVFLEPVTRAGIPHTLPKTYVRLLQDQALEPATQDEQIANLRAFPGGALDVVELDAGHDVMISAPRKLAQVLNLITARSRFPDPAPNAPSRRTSREAGESRPLRASTVSASTAKLAETALVVLLGIRTLRIRIDRPVLPDLA